MSTEIATTTTTTTAITPELQAAQQAASSVHLLLSEDPALADLLSSNSDTAVYAYASSSVTLSQVEGKLALAESLAAKVSRTSPEAVTRHLLQLYPQQQQQQSSTSSSSLPAFRDACTSLERQADSLCTTATRVATVLEKQYDRLPVEPLERCLTISGTLKQLLRMQFELQKLREYDVEDDDDDDVRDLTKAAASVSILEDIIQSIPDAHRIHVIAHHTPEIRRYSQAIRTAAKAKLHRKDDIPAYLQIHFALGNLGDAVWTIMEQAHRVAIASSTNSNAKQDWTNGCRQGLNMVRTMTRFLAVQTDPVSRVRYRDVVAAAPRPPPYANTHNNNNNNNKANLRLAFWERYCHALADTVWVQMDAATAYPNVRRQVLEILDRYVVNAGGGGGGGDSTEYDEAMSGGILGGTVHDAFLLSSGGQQPSTTTNTTTTSSAARWTRSGTTKSSSSSTSTTLRNSSFRASDARINLTAVLNSPEWKLMSNVGLRGLEQSFVEACQERLLKPVRLLFPDDNSAIVMDETMVNTAPALPSKYDIQRLDETIRGELSLADPQDGGDTTLVTMIAECVVISVAEFCERAPFGKNGRDAYIRDSDWSTTEDLQHDRKVVAILFALQNYLNKAPEATFVTPYQPSILEQHREAAKLCDMALKPACKTIDTAIQNAVLRPLLVDLKKQMGAVLTRVVSSSYSPSFCQSVITPALETIRANILKRFPPKYASFVAHELAEFSIRTFVTATTLVRPLDEEVRLHITQDLGDLELALQDLVDEPLSNAISAYAELRACRQMLFWTGLTGSSAPASDIAKSLMGQVWLQDVRPSTVYHYLISSFGPTLLSSPQHAAKMSAAAYVATTVAGEDSAWVAVLSCCDTYQQRRSADDNQDGGDPRVADIVTLLGRELMRRRGRN